jgi:NOL1/NOP2/sun family putative RNA methylase
LYCYDNEKYQALRLNPLKKGCTPEGEARILEVLAKTAGAAPGEENLQDAASGENVSAETPWTAVPWAQHAFYYDASLRPGKHAYHEMGLYYIQEPSAMSAAALLAPQPGMRVLDLCAAPGGKTTQLASYLGQQGLLVANEIHPARCKILSQNVERMGIANAIVTNEDSGKLAEKFPAFFHAILVDAPCSGEGMFRKNPDAMAEWSPAQVLLCADRQREILNNAAEMLLPGGTLVYSTCTFSPEENEQTIAHFLDTHPEFSVEKRNAPWFDAGVPAWGLRPENSEQSLGTEPEQAPERPELSDCFRLWPHHLHGEGHFAAVLKKAGTLPEFASDESMTESGGNQTDSIAAGQNRESATGRNRNRKSADREGNSNTPDRQQQKVLAEFLDSTLSKEAADWILRGKLTLFGDQLFRLPEDAPPLSGLRVLRAGLHIGEFKKNRFEPSHALALALGEADVKSALELTLSDARVNAFFNGEVLQMEIPGKGWTLVCVDGFSAGWGKAAGCQLKNHYPKGLRKTI